MAGPFTRTLQLNPVDVTINQSLYVKHRIAKVIRTGGTAWVHSMMLTLLPGDYLWYDALTRHGATSEPIIIQPTTIRGVQPPRQNIVSYSESGSGGGVMWSITRCFPSVLSLSLSWLSFPHHLYPHDHLNLKPPLCVPTNLKGTTAKLHECCLNNKVDNLVLHLFFKLNLKHKSNKQYWPELVEQWLPMPSLCIPSSRAFHHCVDQSSELLYLVFSLWCWCFVLRLMQICWYPRWHFVDETVRQEGYKSFAFHSSCPQLQGF